MTTDAIRLTGNDITTLDVDAIVNAANEALAPGGGVCGAIFRAAGPDRLEAACRAIPEVEPGVRCPTGEARITPGFDLPARYVIHTVGPVWRGGDQREEDLLAACYRNSLDLAATHHLRSIAFPAISCGIFGFPVELACRVALAAVRAGLKTHAHTLESVEFCCFDPDVHAAYQRLLTA